MRGFASAAPQLPGAPQPRLKPQARMFPQFRRLGVRGQGSRAASPETSLLGSPMATFCLDFPGAGDPSSSPGSGRCPWRRAWQPTPVFLPGESLGQRSLAGCSPWARKESDMMERLTLHFLPHLTRVRILACFCKDASPIAQPHLRTSFCPASVCVRLLQSCLTLCNSMNCSLSGPLSMGFSRQEYWSGLPFPSPGDRPHPGIKPASLMSPAWAGTFFSTSATRETPFYLTCLFKGLVSKQSLLRCQRLGLPHMSLWGTEFNP